MLTNLKVKMLNYVELRSKGQKNPGALLPNRHPDRDGLYLAVSPPPEMTYGIGYGAKSWRYDFRFPRTTLGRRRVITYGRYPRNDVIGSSPRALAGADSLWPLALILASNGSN